MTRTGNIVIWFIIVGFNLYMAIFAPPKGRWFHVFLAVYSLAMGIMTIINT